MILPSVRTQSSSFFGKGGLCNTDSFYFPLHFVTDSSASIRKVQTTHKHT